MANKVRGKQIQVEPRLFHFSLTNFLVFKELNKRNQLWQSFVDSSNLVVDVPTSSMRKKETPLVVTKYTQPPTGKSRSYIFL